MSKAYDNAVELLRNLYYFRYVRPSVLGCSKYFSNAPFFVDKWETMSEEISSTIENSKETPQFYELIKSFKEVLYKVREAWRFIVLNGCRDENKENMKIGPKSSALVQSCPDVLKKLHAI